MTMFTRSFGQPAAAPVVQDPVGQESLTSEAVTQEASGTQEVITTDAPVVEDAGATQEAPAAVVETPALEVATQEAAAPVVDAPAAEVVGQESNVDQSTDQAPVEETAALESLETPVPEIKETMQEAVVDAPVAEVAPATQEATQEEGAAAQVEAVIVAEEANTTQEDGQAEAVVANKGFVRSSVASKSNGIFARFDMFSRHDRSVQALNAGVRDLEMITNYTQVAQEYNFTAPMVATMRATPGFDAAVEKFPETALYNLVPEHRTSATNGMGLESMADATVSNATAMSDKAKAVASSFAAVLSSIPATVDNLMGQVMEEKQALANSDLTDEVMATLPVHTLSHTAFTVLLNKLSDEVSNTDVFNVEDIRANPEKLGESVQNLKLLVDDVGSVLGLQISQYGLCEDDKDAAFEPSPGTFEDKAIDKAGLNFYLDTAVQVLDSLKGLSDRAGAITTSTDAAAVNIPTAVNGDDVTYGCMDHVMLLSCYTTLVSKLVRESVVTVTMLLATVDAALDVDDGLQA